MGKFIVDEAALESRLAQLCVREPAAPDIHREASRAVSRTFLAALPVTTRRIDAYFRACVRRASLRAGGDPASLLVLQAVVRDLASHGRSAVEIWDEVTRGWSDSFSPGVMDECRRMLGMAA